MTKRTAMAILLAVTGMLPACAPDEAAAGEPAGGETATVFERAAIGFAPDGSGDPGHASRDNGRVAEATVTLPERDGPERVTAHLTILPIPKDEVSVHDPWDRAGNVRLVVDDGPDIEVVKFVTAYGGSTSYSVDVTHLAPLLCGRRTFRAFIDTWVDPAWLVSFDLEYAPDASATPPSWALPLVYEESVTEELMREGPVEAVVDVPDGTERVLLNYLVSGHCTDGTDADEFVSKDNVIYVDGVAVYRFRPWRDDCRSFRAANPYTRRWSNGVWSSDYSRSGWCPGDAVAPVTLDLTDHLTPGRHTVGFAVENVRPRDENEDFGYWRVSSHAFGWVGE